MDRDVVFARAFCGEIEKVAMEKEGLFFLPALAAGLLLGGGATAAGLSGFGKPKDVVQRKWHRPGDIGKTLTYFGGLSGAAAPGAGGALGLGFRGLGLAEAAGTVAGGKRTGLAWRPPSIARTPLNRQPRKMTGAF